METITNEFKVNAVNGLTNRKLATWSSMTDRNYHTEVVSKIAEHFFGKTSRYFKEFKAIIAIHKKMGSMPYDMVIKRSDLTKQMMQEIEINYGKEITDKVYACL